MLGTWYLPGKLSISALHKNKDDLIEALGRDQYHAQCQLPGLPKKKSSGSGANGGNGAVVGDERGGKSGLSGIGSDNYSNS